jgi:hypothetical protein
VTRFSVVVYPRSAAVALLLGFCSLHPFVPPLFLAIAHSVSISVIFLEDVFVSERLHEVDCRGV